MTPNSLLTPGRTRRRSPYRQLVLYLFLAAFIASGFVAPVAMIGMSLGACALIWVVWFVLALAALGDPDEQRRARGGGR
jgi:hypothetical protein